jgi:hypothetical protein
MGWLLTAVSSILLLWGLSLSADGSGLDSVGRARVESMAHAAQPYPEDTDLINVRNYGAAGDGVTDDSAAIIAARTAAQAAHGVLWFPQGTYLINRSNALEISSTSAFTMRGVYGGSTLKAGTTMAHMLDFTNPSTSQYFVVEGLCFDGNGQAATAIHGDHLAHTIISRCIIMHTTASAIKFSEGWCNDIVECEIKSNRGDGICGSNAVNAFNITRCKIFLNDGMGIKLQSGSGVSITGCTLETNKKCGIYAQFIRCLSVTGNYFEGNGEIGWPVTDPETLSYKCDIVLNGHSADTSLAYAYPCYDVVVVGNYFAPGASCDGVIYAGGVNQLRVQNNYLSAKAPLLVTYGHASYAEPVQLEVADNYNTSPVMKIDKGWTGVPSYPAMSHTWSFGRQERKNYLDQNFLGYTTVASRNGGSLVRSSMSCRGYPAYEIRCDGGHSDAFGWTIDVDSACPELLNQLVWVGFWYYWDSPEADMNFSVYCSVASGGNPWHADYYSRSPGTWQFFSKLIPMPATAPSFRIGIAKFGTSDRPIVIAQPILTLAGNPYEEFPLDPQRVRFKASAAPTTGTWQVDDIVYSTMPGGTEGWICIKGGTPGIWTTIGSAFGIRGVSRGAITLWNGQGGNAPGYVEMHSSNGTAWYLSVDDQGVLKAQNNLRR